MPTLLATNSVVVPIQVRPATWVATSHRCGSSCAGCRTVRISPPGRSLRAIEVRSIRRLQCRGAGWCPGRWGPVAVVVPGFAVVVATLSIEPTAVSIGLRCRENHGSQQAARDRAIHCDPVVGMTRTGATGWELKIIQWCPGTNGLRPSLWERRFMAARVQPRQKRNA